MEVNLGAIRFNWKGAYAGATAYVADDVVSSGGASYICILASTGNATSNATYWSVMSSAGTNGTDVGTTITTQGDLLFRDGSGLQRLAKGTAAQVLAMNAGATAPEWQAAAAGGAWNFIRSQAASSSTTLEFTTDIDSTYDVYKIIYSDLEFSTDVTFVFRIGAGSYDSGSTDYSYAFKGMTGSGGSDVQSNGADSISLTGGIYQGGASNESAQVEVTLYTPSDTTHYKTIGVQYMGQRETGKAHQLIGCGVRLATAAYTRIQLSLHAGTIVSGTARLYGISNS